MTDAQAARIMMVEDQLEVLGWSLTAPASPGDHWVADSGGATVHGASPESLLQTIQGMSEPGRARPPRKSRPPKPRKGRRGRRPRKDALENLLRCPKEERPGLPCLALVWRRPQDLRNHLAKHLGSEVVKGLTVDQVRRQYERPTDVADDGTGDLPEGQADPSETREAGNKET